MMPMIILEIVWTFVKMIITKSADKKKELQKHMDKLQKKFRKKSTVDQIAEEGYEEEERLKKL